MVWRAQQSVMWSVDLLDYSPHSLAAQWQLIQQPLWQLERVGQPIPACNAAQNNKEEHARHEAQTSRARDRMAPFVILQSPSD